MARTALCLVEQTPQRSSCREAEKTLQLPPSPAPGSWSSLLDAQPCCFSPSLYSDSEFPNPDGPSPSTKDIRGAQVSAPSLCVCVGGGMANPGIPSLDPEISGVTEPFLLKEVKALNPCFSICSPQAHHNPPRSSECKRLGLGWSWGWGCGGELGVRGRGRLRVGLPAQRSRPDSTSCVLGSNKGHL